MITQERVLSDSWEEIGADGEDFAFQNIDATGVVLLKYSDAAPTNDFGAIRVYPNEGWLSSYGSGKIWAKALTGEAKTSLTK